MIQQLTLFTLLILFFFTIKYTTKIILEIILETIILTITIIQNELLNFNYTTLILDMNKLSIVNSTNL